jgi:hypothetical protein
MNDQLLDQYVYVKKVVKSCVTKEQLANAKSWAEDWAKRMKVLYPQDVHSWTDLYLSVVEA